MARVVCALSGGVDSSVAASLLVDAGHEVVGVFLRNGVAKGAAARAKSCCSASDARDAARVARLLGIRFYAVDYAREFDALVERFVAEYRAGRTPSPCVSCNQDLKFGRLFELADALDAEAIATGHYARIAGGAITRPADTAKDQTYYLFGVERSVLPRMRFPLGDLSKAEVRALAKQRGLPNADKPESMEICFVPSGDYRDVVRARTSPRAGRFVDARGNEVGTHAGVEGFTIGQRRGLPALGSKHYVVELRPETGDVVVGERPALASAQMVVEQARWLVDAPACGTELRAHVQIRARHRAAPARLVAGGEHRGAGEGSDRVLVRFDCAQEAITPGQAAAFYDGPRLLGGGWIAHSIRV